MDRWYLDRVRRRLPVGLLGMVALIAAVEGFVARHDLDFATEWSADRRFTVQVATRQAAASEILCFGDSQVKFGVMPGILGGRLSRPAYNLAIHAGQPPSSYLLLRKVLEAGGRPAAVVVDFKPGLLHRPPQNEIRTWVELVDLRDGIDLAWTARDAGFFGAIMVGQVLPTARARFELRDRIWQALHGQSGSMRDFLLTRRRNWRHNRGAQVMPAGLFNSAPLDLAAHKQRWGPKACDRLNAIFLIRFFKLATARDIPVFWVLPPIQPAVQALLDRAGDSSRFDRFVKEIQARYPNLVVVDGRHSGYDESALNDPLHLNRVGAAALSVGLAAVVRCSLDEPPGKLRWVNLPVYRAGGDDRPLEDVQQSHLVLRHAEAPTRRR